MATFNGRLISKQDLLYGFAICALPIHVWSIFIMLHEIPGWLLRLNLWDLIGAIAYTQAFALFETVIILFVLAILSLLVPAKLFRNNFLAHSTAFILITAIWFILIRINETMVNQWGMAQYLLWFLIYLVSVGIPYIWILRSSQLEKALNSFVQRASVLSFVYLFVDVVSIFIIAIRNF